MAIQFDNTNTGSATLKPATSGTLALTLPSADGTVNQVLTTNGSGQLSFATPSGGVTGFTGAESTAAPNATAYVDSLTSSAASTDADVAFVAKGTGATLAQVPDSTTTGGDKRGTYATDWQKSRTAATQVASGSYSVIAGGSNNTASATGSFVSSGSSNQATEINSAVVGGSNNATNGLGAVISGGEQNSANGTGSFLGGGAFNSTSGTYSTVIGGIQNTANATHSSVVGGRQGNVRSIVANIVLTGSSIPIASSSGVSQSALLVLGRQTTNATPTVLSSNTTSATSTNQVILPNNAAYYFKGSIVAGVTGAGNSSAWTFEGLIKRGASAASTVIVQSVINLAGQDTGASSWVVALSADTTNGGLSVTCTGQASTTIRWVCKVETTEMTY